MSIIQTIKEFEEKFVPMKVEFDEEIGHYRYPSSKIISFLLRSHLNYLLEEKKRLEGDIRDIPYAPETDKMFADRIFNSAITQQLEHLEEEIKEVESLLSK
jgi:hypothetical protein